MIMSYNKSSIMSNFRHFGDLIHFIQLRSLTPTISSDFTFLLVYVVFSSLIYRFLIDVHHCSMRTSNINVSNTTN